MEPRVTASNPRRANGTARTKLRRWLRAKGEPCALCGEPIDYTLPPGDPYSFEVDEIIPVSRWREGGYPSAEACALDRDNVQAAHRICNQRKGNAIKVRRVVGTAGADRTPTSRDWRSAPWLS